MILPVKLYPFVHLRQPSIVIELAEVLKLKCHNLALFLNKVDFIGVVNDVEVTKTVPDDFIVSFNIICIVFTVV